MLSQLCETAFLCLLLQVKVKNPMGIGMLEWTTCTTDGRFAQIAVQLSMGSKLLGQDRPL